MKPFLILSCFLSLATSITAQRTEEGFDVNFQRTNNTPHYFVITEKTGDLWHRKAYYIYEKSQAMEGWYLDQDCKKEEGRLSWFHPNKKLHYTGEYKNGKREGLWLKYHDNGMMFDSSMYFDDHLIGTRLQWNEEGMLIDSSVYDGTGKFVQVTWYPKGQLASAGLWINDTTKDQRWKYYHPNGQLNAIEEYSNGELLKRICYDESGKGIDASLCIERESTYKEDPDAWIQFLRHTLDPNVPIRNNAPVSSYQVMMQFEVDTSGKIGNIKPITHFGFGMEEEVTRILNKSPKWIPALRFGRKVKAYRKQPITFVVYR